MSVFEKRVKFSDWLHFSLKFCGKDPWVWFGYCVFVGLLLCLIRISYFLGIWSAVTSLFVGVGVAKYIDLKRSTPENAVGLFWAIKKSLPLAIIMGGMLVICWFVFSALANILEGKWQMISYFFFEWQYTEENLRSKDTRELGIFLFGHANIFLIFTLLMLATFASWYSYPLMLFRDYSWSKAKAAGIEQTDKQKEAYYKTLAFLIFEAILCIELTPWLTPVLYMLTSTFMFYTYKQFFEKEAPHEEG